MLRNLLGAAKEVHQSTPSEGVSLTKNSLPERRHFLRNLVLLTVGYVGAEIGFSGPDTTNPLVLKDSLELLLCIKKFYGDKTSFVEGPLDRSNIEQEKVAGRILNVSYQAPPAPEVEGSFSILSASFSRTSSFAITIPSYIAHYQQAPDSDEKESFDCNDHSNVAGELCKRFGLVSYHISVSPKNWSDFFRTDSHQFHAIKLAPKQFLFIDGSSCSGPEVTLWHGTLQSYIDDYRISGKPVSLISVIGITKHTSHQGVIKRLSNHLIESVGSEDEMESNNLDLNPLASEYIQEHQ